MRSKQYQSGSSNADADAADYEISIVSQLLWRGIVVTVTDYQGQGTPGLPSYLVGRPEAYAGLDAVRAAKRLHSTGLSQHAPVGIAGYSQGGQAAGWAAELQPEYAPELNLKGVALGGVPADMNLTAKHLNGGRGAGFLFAALSGVDFAYPELGLDERYLNAQGVEAMRQIRQEDCIFDWYNFKKFDGDSTSEITEPDVLTLPDWQRRFAESAVGTKPLPVPAYLYHGTTDELVPFSGFQQLRDAWCRQGATVTLQEFPGMDHVQALHSGTVPATQWLAERFTGHPAPDNC